LKSFDEFVVGVEDGLCEGSDYIVGLCCKGRRERVAIRHALSPQDPVDVKFLVSTDGAGEWAAVVFDGEIPVDWTF